jgi:3-hydroxyacyl-CoA dehydrogenase
LPEVTLGIIPGAGGTQRLPRLIDPAAAIEIMASGKPIDAAKALALGLVDRVADGDVVDDAVAFANEKPAAAGRRISERVFAIDPAKLDTIEIDVKKSAKGAAAAVELVAMLRATVGQSFAEASKAERALFLRLRESLQAKALRHIFFAEREAAKPPADVADVQPLAVKRVGIIGAGTMGGGIAMSYADAGITVKLLDMKPEAVEAGLARIRKNYESSAVRGRITQAQVGERVGRIEGGTDYGMLADCDVIIEAVFESMEVKRTVFTALDRVAKPGAILATNTSYLDVNEIAATTSRPEAVIGLHYFSPANVMKLLEIVRAKKTGASALVTALAIAKSTGKIPVVAGVCPGFIGNRMLRAYTREAGLLLIEGATPAQVDKALTGFGMAMGPFAVADLAGIDIGYKARKEMAPGSFEPLAVAIHDALVERGHLGQKTGAGFYRYDKATGARTPHEIVDDLIAEARIKAGIAPRAISDKEIVQRTMMALVNEGAWILEEGIARAAGDIDVVYVNGYGFPRHRGGPMFYAEADVGLGHAIALIEGYQRGPFGKWWPISTLLRTMDEKAAH